MKFVGCLAVRPCGSASLWLVGRADVWHWKRRQIASGQAPEPAFKVNFNHAGSHLISSRSHSEGVDLTISELQTDEQTASLRPVWTIKSVEAAGENVDASFVWSEQDAYVAICFRGGNPPGDFVEEVTTVYCHSAAGQKLQYVVCSDDDGYYEVAKLKDVCFSSSQHLILAWSSLDADSAAVILYTYDLTACQRLTSINTGVPLFSPYPVFSLDGQAFAVTADGKHSVYSIANGEAQLWVSCQQYPSLQSCWEQ